MASGPVPTPLVVDSQQASVSASTELFERAEDVEVTPAVVGSWKLHLLAINRLVLHLPPELFRLYREFYSAADEKKYMLRSRHTATMTYP